MSRQNINTNIIKVGWTFLKLSMCKQQFPTANIYKATMRNLNPQDFSNAVEIGDLSNNDEVGEFVRINIFNM